MGAGVHEWSNKVGLHCDTVDSRSWELSSVSTEQSLLRKDHSEQGGVKSKMWVVSVAPGAWTALERPSEAFTPAAPPSVLPAWG